MSDFQFNLVITSTWRTATERSDFGQHALALAWHDELSPEHLIHCHSRLMEMAQGEADEYGTVAQIEAIQRSLPGRTETLLLPGTGHSPHKDREPEVLSATARFIRSLE